MTSLLTHPDTSQSTQPLAAELRRRAARRLGVAPERIALDRPLLGFGLDSLAAVELQQEAAAELGVALSLASLLDGASLLELAAEAAAGTPAAGTPAATPLTAGPEELEYPLSHGQRALWFLQQLAPESAAYHVVVALRVRGGLDPAPLQAAFQAVADRHPALRSTFHAEAADGAPGPVQRVHHALPVEFTCEEAAGEDLERLAARLRQAARRPFALARGPLLRVALARRAADDHLMLVAVHHLVADFASLALIFADLERLYAHGEAPAAPPPAVRYSDYVRWQAAHLAGTAGETLWAWWRQALAGPLPPLELPTDRPRPPLPSDRGGLRTCALEAAASDRVGELAAGSGATLFHVLLAGFMALLDRYAGRHEVTVGCPAAGRGAAALAGVVGYFVNPVVVRAAPEDFAGGGEAGGASFARFLGQLRRRAASAFEHQDFPFALLAERLQPQREPGRSPIFQVLFTLQQAVRPEQQALAPLAVGAAGAAVGLGPLTLTALGERDRPAQLDLTLEAARGGERLLLALGFNRDLFEATTIERMLGHFRTLIAAAAADPAQPVAHLPLFGAGERQQLLREWNPPPATPLAAAGEPMVAALFERQAERVPERLAVVAGARELTYGEIERRANRLAHHLRRLGIAAETLVGIYVERSPQMVVALLGVLKAGGAYLPLDPAPAYPAERLAAMLADSRAPLVLTEERLRPALAGYRGQLLCLDTDWRAVEREPATRPPRRGTGDSLAYVIYTSGSTGRPKGVAVRQGAVASFLRSMRRAPGLGPEDVLLAVTTLSFDIAALEIFLPLAAGARVTLADRETAADGARLLAELAASGATAMQATPSTWRLLLAAGWEGTPRIRALCGGEALPRELAERLLARASEVWNLYGPTETTIWSAAARVRSAAGPVPVGRPIDDTTIYVVSRALELLPPGAPGELLIGGAGLARGYFERPEATAASFIPDPFGAGSGGRGGRDGRHGAGARLYRTGDLARWRGDGTLECLGRLDQQVKVRGVRIELGEVETVLARHPAVAQAVVAARHDPAGGERLVAYVVPAAAAGAAAPAGGLDLRALREHLAARLPDSFIPSLFVTLAHLPLTANGKVDRRALPAPAGGRPELAGDYAAPAAGLEHVIAETWRQELGLAAVGRHDNFFELGGHSLLLARVHTRLQRELGRELPLLDLVRHPTVHALARHLATAGAPRGFPGGAGEAMAEAEGGSPAGVQERPSATAAALATSGAARRRARGEDGAVAIIGRAGRFPGAVSVAELWRRLRGGEECVARLSDDELRAAGVPPSELADPRYVKAAGVLAGAEELDAAFFGFSPREAELMDPQHRVFLECAWEALEDAGYDSLRHDGRIGVYAGVGINAYLHHAGLLGLRELSERYQAFISNDKDFVPTRVSYKLDLTGPSVNVQTACSSSLVAVHLACQALAAGDCDMALAGGVSIRVPQHAGYLHEPAGIGSPDGHCRVFDEQAAGTVFGSGAGLVVLKPLAAALADGDTVHAVIRGTAINNDGGRKLGYTAPSIAGQAAVVAAALAAAGVEPESLGYVEAHGTGTALGDPIEVAALREVWSRGGARRQPAGSCALGSVKSNVGHLDTAAGICGLIKAVESLAHRELPPSLHFTTPNPKLELAASPFYVNSRLQPWAAAGGPRRAGVSSFGIGGTNAHVVLEEAPPDGSAAGSLPADPTGAAAGRSLVLLPLSARTAAALDAASSRLAEHLRGHAGIALADAAYTLQVGRRAFPHRRILLCRERAEAVEALAASATSAAAGAAGADGAARAAVAARLRTAVAPAGGERAVAFLFPGQGAQHAGMGLGLYRTEPVLRRELDRCAELLQPALGLDLRRLLFPSGGYPAGPAATAATAADATASPAAAAGDAAAEAERRLAETRHAQPALFALEYSLARLWMSWGVEPQAMLGHSIGEYVAACLAGVMTLPDALALVAARGRLMQSLPAGAMLAVELPEAELAARLPAELSLAAVNGPAACVVSGPPAPAAAFASRLAAEGVRHRRLHTSHAFHSGMMEPILVPFAAEVARCRLHPPARPWVSGVTGTWVTPEEAVDPAYWSRQLRATVRFGDGLATLLGAPERVLLEVGPGNALSGLALRRRDGLPASAASAANASGPPTPAVPAIASMRHPREPLDDSEALLGALGRLWLAGVEVDWQRFAASDERRRRRVSLPTYPFERQRYWLASSPAPELGRAAEPAAAGKRGDLAEWLSVPAWRQVPARLGAERPGGPWLVLLPPRPEGAGDGGARPLVERLAERLATRGGVTTVEPAAPAGPAAPKDGGGAPLRRLAPNCYALDPAAREGFDALLQELAAAGRAPRHVVHAWTLGAVGEGEEAQALALDSLLLLAQACERALPGAPLALSVLTSGLHQVAGQPSDAALHPEKALLLGPLTVLPQEHPNVRCQSIDLVVPPLAGREHGDGEQRQHAEAEQEQVARLIAELAELERALPAAGPAGGAAAASAAGRRSRVLALRGGELFARDFAPLRLAPGEESAPRVRPGGAYLITGGWGGIGAVLARELARLAPVKLALLGRHGPPAAAGTSEIAALEAAGAEVLPLVADVADREAMAAAIRRAEERLGPLRGVIHAAGVAGGGILQWKTPAAARRVLAPKLAGTLVLEELLRGRELDFFLVCSSITSLAGGFGQSDYCAANAFCDAYAQAVSRRDARVGRLTVAVGWDRWEEVGMAARATAGAGASPAAGVAVGGVAGAAAAAAPDGSGSTGHPLLGTCIAASARRAVFRSWLSAERHWVLAEHRVAGVPTLPGTTYVEIARAALAFLLGGGTGAAAFGPPVELRDVVFLTPLAAPPGQTREVLTVLAAPAGGSGGAGGGGPWSFRVVSRPVAAAGEPAPAAWQEHARGEIGHLPALPAPAAAPAVAAAPSAPCVAGRDVPLAGLERAGDLVATGPRWRSLRRLVAAGGEGMATLELAPELAADLAELPLHPALLDLAAGAVRLPLGGSFLPLAYQRLRLFAPLPPRCRSHFRRHAGNDAGLLTCDVTIYDPEGTPVAEIEGFTMRRLGEAAAVQLHAAQAEAAAGAAPNAPPPASTASSFADASAADTAHGSGEALSRGEAAAAFAAAATGSSSAHGSGQAVSRGEATAALAAAAAAAAPAAAAGILPAEGAEIFRRILCLDPAARQPHLVVSTAPLAAVLAAADALDREALAERLAEAAAAAPAHARPAVATAYAAPDDELERRIAEAWQQVLGIERVGVHDNFFELGGTSLAAIQLVSELRRRLGVELPSVAVFEAPTIQRLAVYLRPAPVAASLAARGRLRAEKQRGALAGLRQAATAAPRRRVP